MLFWENNQQQWCEVFYSYCVNFYDSILIYDSTDYIIIIYKLNKLKLFGCLTKKNILLYCIW